jgi:Ser/Thr protein kinase RdoA (MazF antagonist)
MSLLKHAPGWDVSAARHLAKSLYGISAEATPLPSERDQNFLLTDEAGRQFVLKFANALENAHLLQAQNEVLKHLASRITYCPRILPTLAGEEMSRADSEGNLHFVRLISYLPGVPLGEIAEHSQALLCDFGQKLGMLDHALADFDHPALHREFYWDLADSLKVVHQHNELIHDAELRTLVRQIAEDFKGKITQLEPKLRRSVIHGDANDYNVLATPGESIVAGIIDFGDMVHSHTVNDLAIATAYVVLRSDDVISTVSTVAEGYMRKYPLNEYEIISLWPLVLMRLCMSVSLAAYQRQQQPENEYLSISQKAIQDRLPALAQLDWSIVTEALTDRARQVQFT